MARGGLVLVTGGLGFIGGYVARALLEQHRPVAVLTRGKTTSPEMRFVLREHEGRFITEVGSVENLARLGEIFARLKPSTVVHSASNVDVAALYRDPYVAFQTNVTGTLNVYEAARRSGVRRVVDMSSIGVLPPNRYQPIDAAHPIILARSGPGSGAYGASKVAGEVFGFAYQQAYGLDVRIVRPSAVYGFGMQWHSANYMKQFVEPAVRGEAVRVASGGRLPRDYTHVVDVAELTVRVVDCPDDADRVFYAATGGPLVTASEAARLVAELIPGSRVEVADTMTPDDEVEASFRGVISIENARNQLGWTPRYGSLREGVSEYIASYRAYLAATSQVPT
ncbi:MAG TPA: NAD(P)-dependent oxidoreductase [Candidatus Limnocylindrales bacterium]|nr:NAD(P)-dependent oxidoreductase [Candidatus Limnocylindrales bacterium]